ncbi:MAG: hypothetical protein WBP58_00620 [Chitinophagaceae bacterium]
MQSKVFGLIIIAGALVACGDTGKTAEQAVVADTVAVTKDGSATATVPAQPVPFSQVANYDDKRSFNVSSPQLAEKNTVLIVPAGFTASNDGIQLDVEGQVVKVEVADISGDNSPELLVVTKDAGNHGHAYVFSGNNNKSVSQVNIEDATSTKGAMDGYNGEDEYALVETVFARRFPVYESGAKTGKTRQIQFKLRNGEAMKQLKVDKVTTF